MTWRKGALNWKEAEWNKNIKWINMMEKKKSIKKDLYFYEIRNILHKLKSEKQSPFVYYFIIYHTDIFYYIWWCYFKNDFCFFVLFTLSEFLYFTLMNEKKNQAQTHTHKKRKPKERTSNDGQPNNKQ